MKTYRVFWNESIRYEALVDANSIKEATEKTKRCDTGEPVQVSQPDITNIEVEKTDME
jgi:hypothetical protein